MKSFFTALLLALSTATLAQSGAHSPWERLGPIGFAALAQQGQSTVVATTSNGYLYISNDWGKTWRHECLDDTLHLGDITFLDSLHGLVNGTSSSGQSPSRYYTVPDPWNTLFLTSDGGASWSRIHVPVESVPQRPTNSNITRVAYPSIDTFYASDNFGIVWRTTDRGANWDAQLADSNSINGMHFFDSKTGFIVGDQGLFAKTTDAGETWTRQDIGAGDTTQLFGMSFYNRSIGVVYGFGYSYVTTDGGTDWIYKPTPVSGHNILYTASWVNGHQFFAFGPSGQIYNVNGIGSDMTVALLDPSGSEPIVGTYMTASLFSEEYGCLAVSSEGLVMGSPDALQWKPITQYGPAGRAFTATFADAWYSKPTGEPLIFSRSTDAGLTWQVSLLGSDENSDYAGLHFSDSLNGLAIGGSSLQLYSKRTSDGGVTWSDAGLQDLNPRFAITLTPFRGNTAFAAGDAPSWGYKYVLRTSDDCQTWTIDSIPPDWKTAPYSDANPSSIGVGSICIVDKNIAYMSEKVSDTIIGRHPPSFKYHSLLYSTSDGGQTWIRVINAPMTPFSLAIYFWDQNVGYVCCDSSTLYRTTDAGVTWLRTQLPMSSGTHILTAINFRDSLHGYVGTNDRPLIFMTSDGGETWEDAHADFAPDEKEYIYDFLFPDSNTVLASGNLGYYKNTITPPASVTPISSQSTEPLTIYPNPAISLLHIESSTSDIIITDLLGRTWLHAAKGSRDLDVSGLPPGVYSISDGKSRAQFVKE